MLTEKKKEFIEFMLSAQVLRFGHFVTKSGRNTQYFVNTGNYKTGAQLSRLGSYYAGLVKETVGDQFEAMFGPAYKGIPLATACSIALYNDHGIDRPYFFNRKEVKDHGEGGGTVGYAPKDGDRIIIIEDVITAGGPLRGGSDPRQNRHHGSGRGVWCKSPSHRHGGGYPRVLKEPRHRPRTAEGHGRLYGAVLRAVTGSRQHL